MFYANVQSLLANFEKIETIVHEYSPNIIFCTETRIDDTIYTGEYAIQGYNCYTALSPTRHSAGVCVYIKLCVTSELILQQSIGYNSFLIIDILSGIHRGRWVCTYRSPNSSYDDYIHKLDDICNQYKVSGKPFSIIGDFNINVHNAVHHSSKTRLLRSMNIHGLKQKVSKYTRIAHGSKTLIDLLFTDNNTIKVNVIKNHQIADHKSLAIFKVHKVKERVIRTIIDRSKCIPENFMPLMNSNFNVELFHNMSLDQQCEYYQNVMKTSVAPFVSLKNVDIDYAKKWYSRELVSYRKERDSAHRKAEFTDNVNDWLDYRRIRNKYNKQISKAKAKYIKSTVIRCSDDPKKLWRELKKHEKGDSDHINYIQYKGIKYDDPKTCATLCNNYFIESIDELANGIPPVVYVNYIDKPILTEWEQFQVLNYVDLKSIMGKIKSKSGIDNVNVNVFDVVTDTFHKEFLSILNESLQNGICPSPWRKTIIRPIQKIYGTKNLEEFRAVNNITPDNKVVEKYIKEQLVKHLELNSIIHENQSAFREHHSCESAFNLIINKWKEERDNGNMILVVFLDLKRAFETVCRELLIKKMEAYGIKANVLKWFESWLMQRWQATEINGERSDFREITKGIPQGTPLSCVLFLVYINDFLSVLVKCNANLFADDAVIWLAGKCWKTLVENMNSDLERVSIYMKMNKLQLNVSKSKLLVIGGVNLSADVKIDDCLLERVVNVKYLGIIVDEKMKFRDNTDYVIKKMSKKVNWLRRMKKKLDRPTKISIYQSLILPHIDYCSSILFLITKEEMKELQKIQNQSMRAILDETIFAHTEDMLDTLNLPSINQRIAANVIMLLYKAKMGFFPRYMSCNLISLDSVQPYNLRRNELYRLPTFLSNNAQNSLYYKGIKLFNEFLTATALENNLKKDKQLINDYAKTKVARF